MGRNACLEAPELTDVVCGMISAVLTPVED